MVLPIAAAGAETLAGGTAASGAAAGGGTAASGAAARAGSAAQQSARASGPKNQTNTGQSKMPQANSGSEEKTDRIGNVTAVLMIMTALGIDLLQFLFELILIGMVLNWAIMLLAYLMFWLWFRGNGVKFASSPKRLAAFGVGGILEVVPVLQDIIGWLPVFTASILVAILTAKAEDRFAKMGAAGKLGQIGAGGIS